jgi:nitrogen regulatory protein P-II 2
MKYVTAIIQPGRLDPVMEALNELGISGMTVSEVRGYGRQKGKSEVYRGAEYTIQFLPKIKLEIAVSNKEASAVTEAIKTAGETGKIGDGKIFVIDLPEAIRIRTGETGDSAL